MSYLNEMLVILPSALTLGGACWFVGYADGRRKSAQTAGRLELAREDVLREAARYVNHDTSASERDIWELGKAVSAYEDALEARRTEK